MAATKGPKWQANEKQVAKAVALFKSFHGRNPKPGDIKLVVLDGNDVVLSVGPVTRIAYIAKGSGKEYIHTFNKRHRPLLFVSSDGRQFYGLKGGYRFTDRGFVG